MQYSTSPETIVHAGTGKRMHEDNQALPSVLTDSDVNQLTWSLMEIVLAGGQTPQAFDPGVPASYKVLLEALKVLFGGRLLNVRVFTTANNGQSYAETAGTKSIIAGMVGGGGAGGGSVATNSSQYSIGSGGASASWALGRFTTGFSGALITVGAAGAGVSGADGGAGGTTSLGALMSAPGGPGGKVGGAASAASPSLSVSLSGRPSAPSGANLYGSKGQAGHSAICTGTGGFHSGAGGSTPFGAGGSLSLGSNNGDAASGFGAGGGGANSDLSNPARPGGQGSQGLMLVFELA